MSLYAHLQFTCHYICDCLHFHLGHRLIFLLSSEFGNNLYIKCYLWPIKIKRIRKPMGHLNPDGENYQFLSLYMLENLCCTDRFFLQITSCQIHMNNFVLFLLNHQTTFKIFKMCPNTSCLNLKIIQIH